jgi:hypothetical protein
MIALAILSVLYLNYNMMESSNYKLLRNSIYTVCATMLKRLDLATSLIAINKRYGIPVPG